MKQLHGGPDHRDPRWDLFSLPDSHQVTSWGSEGESEDHSFLWLPEVSEAQREHVRSVTRRGELEQGQPQPGPSTLSSQAVLDNSQGSGTQLTCGKGTQERSPNKPHEFRPSVHPACGLGL